MRPRLICLAIALAACASVQEPPRDDEINSEARAFTIPQTVEGEVVDRQYTLHTPLDWDASTPLPLVFAFHGAGAKGDYFVEDLDESIQSRTFIGVYPEGIENSWNLGREASTADDVAFVLSILDDLEEMAGLITTDPVAMGFSNGAGLVHKLAVDTGRFAAIGPMASQLIVGGEPQPGDAHVSVMQLHGTDDEVIPYDGGTDGMDHDFLAAEQSAAVWAAHNGCAPTATETPSGRHVRMEWEGCSSGARVVHYRLEGVGHDMPWSVEGDTLGMLVAFLLSTRP